MVKGDSIDVDGCASLKYETGREKQEHEFFVVPGMNRKIIFGRDWLKQFGVCMYYDWVCIRIGKPQVKMEDDMHISSLARLTTQTVIRPQTEKLCLYIAKINKQLLNYKFHQVIPTEDSTIRRDPGIQADDYIIKKYNQGKFQCSLLTKLVNLLGWEKWSSTDKIETVKECNL